MWCSFYLYNYLKEFRFKSKVLYLIFFITEFIFIYLIFNYGIVPLSLLFHSRDVGFIGAVYKVVIDRLKGVRMFKNRSDEKKTTIIKTESRINYFLAITLKTYTILSYDTVCILLEITLLNTYVYNNITNFFVTKSR